MGRVVFCPNKLVRVVDGRGVPSNPLRSVEPYLWRSVPSTAQEGSYTVTADIETNPITNPDSRYNSDSSRV